MCLHHPGLAVPSRGHPHRAAGARAEAAGLLSARFFNKETEIFTKPPSDERRQGRQRPDERRGFKSSSPPEPSAAGPGQGGTGAAGDKEEQSRACGQAPWVPFLLTPGHRSRAWVAQLGLGFAPRRSQERAMAAPVPGVETTRLGTAEVAQIAPQTLLPPHPRRFPTSSLQRCRWQVRPCPALPLPPCPARPPRR